MWKVIFAIVMCCSVALGQEVRDGQTIDVDLNSVTVVNIQVSGDAPAVADALADQASPPGEIAFPPVLAKGRALPQIELDVKGEPLLAALAKLGAAAKARPSSSWPRSAAITLNVETGEQARTIFSAPASHHGPFAVFLTEINSSHHLPVSGSPGDSRGRPVSFQLQLIGEPKVSVVATNHYLEIEEASDADGKNYVNNEPAHRHESWNAHHQPPVYSFNGSLNNVPREVTRFAVLKGSLKVRAVKKFVVWNLAPAEEKQEVVVDGVTCVVEPIKKPAGRGGDQRIRIRIPKEHLEDQAWNARQEMMRASRFFPYDNAGARLSEGWRGYEQSGDAITLNVNLSQQQQRGIGTFEKLVWHAPIEVEEIVVPFEFKDVPLAY